MPDNVDIYGIKQSRKTSVYTFVDFFSYFAPIYPYYKADAFLTSSSMFNVIKPSHKYLCGPTFCRVLVKVLDKQIAKTEFIYIMLFL